MEKLKTAKEIAGCLDVSTQRIYELCRTDPSFPKILIGLRQYRFSADAVRRWLENGGSTKEGEEKDRQVVWRAGR